MKKVRVLAGIAALTPGVIALAPHAADAATHAVACSPNKPWTRFTHGPGELCFGYNGGTAFETFSATQICGGNNWGWYNGHSGEHGILGSGYFHQGTTFVDLPKLNGGVDEISQVHISGWNGGEVCPQ